MVTYPGVRPQRNKTHQFSYSSNSGTGIRFRMGVRWLLSGGPPQTALTPESRNKKSTPGEKSIADLVVCNAVSRCAFHEQSTSGSSEKKWMLAIWGQSTSTGAPNLHVFP